MQTRPETYAEEEFINECLCDGEEEREVVTLGLVFQEYCLFSHTSMHVSHVQIHPLIHQSITRWIWDLSVHSSSLFDWPSLSAIRLLPFPLPPSRLPVG